MKKFFVIAITQRYSHTYIASVGGRPQQGLSDKLSEARRFELIEHAQRVVDTLVETVFFRDAIQIVQVEEYIELRASQASE